MLQGDSKPIYLDKTNRQMDTTNTIKQEAVPLHPRSSSVRTYCRRICTLAIPDKKHRSTIRYHKKNTILQITIRALRRHGRHLHTS